MAKKLAENLTRWNVEAQMSFLPSRAADLNHWMLYYDVEGKMSGRNTLAITHVDRAAKLHVLKRRMKKADMGICMSRMTLEQMVFKGIPRQKLCFISPGHDGTIQPKRIVIGITSQIRSDGAKREHILVQMARTIRLDYFHFDIVGPNWEKIIPVFEAAGATVSYHSGARQKDNAKHLGVVLKALKRFDYYLYMGWDEGSMGLLEALAAGIPTIVTPQGFHLDINNGITHSFTDANDLCEIFLRIAKEKEARVNSVRHLTWNEYARKHALVWHSIMKGSTEGMDSLLHQGEIFSTNMPQYSPAGWRKNWSRVKNKKNFQSLWEDIAILWEFYMSTKIDDTLGIKILSRFRHFTKRLFAS